MSAGPPRHADADVRVDAALVQALVAQQHPTFTGPVRPLAVGWDNALFRVGEAHIARMPRRRLGVASFQRERAILPALPGLPLEVPRALAIGRPALGYPYPWALTPYLAGHPAAEVPLEPRAAEARLFAFFDALHVPCPGSIPSCAARSMPLSERDAQVRPLLESPLEQAWRAAMQADPWKGPRVWVHGDLHPYNLLAREGALVAALDWGDAFGGDPAPDLAAVWMVLDPSAVQALRERTDGDTWRRARGWAVYFAVVLRRALEEGAGQGFAPVVERTLHNLTTRHPSTTFGPCVT